MSTMDKIPKEFNSPGPKDTLNLGTLLGTTSPQSQTISQNLLDTLDQQDLSIPSTQLPTLLSLNQDKDMWKPYTWDPNGAFSKTGRWVPEKTPDSGESNQSTAHTPGQNGAALTQIPTQVSTDNASLANASLGSLTHTMLEATDLLLWKYHAHLLIK